MNTSSHPFIQRQAWFRFYAELNDYLPPDRRFKPMVYGFIGTPSVKDMIEAQQVPHTEVDLILVNGSSVNFAYRLKGEEEISAYPVFERLDLKGLQRLRPKPLRQTRFIADVHLGQVARYCKRSNRDQTPPTCPEALLTDFSQNALSNSGESAY